MKGVVVRQPWAELIASGKKTLETRRRRTSYRGPLAIVAGKKIDEAACRHFAMDPAGFVTGCIVAVTKLVDCRPMTPEDAPAACCPFSPGLYVWQLAKTHRTKPVPYQGTRGLFAIRNYGGLQMGRSGLFEKSPCPS